MLYSWTWSENSVGWLTTGLSKALPNQAFLTSLFDQSSFSCLSPVYVYVFSKLLHGVQSGRVLQYGTSSMKYRKHNLQDVIGLCELLGPWK